MPDAIAEALGVKRSKHGRSGRGRGGEKGQVRFLCGTETPELILAPHVTRAELGVRASGVTP